MHFRQRPRTLRIGKIGEAPFADRIDDGPVLCPVRRSVHAAAADMERVVARVVPSAVSRAGALEACCLGHFKRLASEICGAAERKGEMADFVAQGRLQLVPRLDDLVHQPPAIGDFTDVGMRAGVGPDLDPRPPPVAQLLDRVRGQVMVSHLRVMHKRLSLQHGLRGDKVRAGNLLFDQQRQGDVAVVGVAVVEGDDTRRGGN